MYSTIGLVILLAIISFIDLKKQVIPDKLALACFLLSAVSLLFSDDTTTLSGILGCALCGGILLMLSFVTKDGIGLGDAKLFAAVGLGLGAARAVNALMISAVLSGMFGLILMLINVRNRKKTIPFAPFILLAVLIVLNS